MNRLYYGDCLTVLRDIIPAQSIDLAYLDPPFNSNREYNNIYKDETGRPLPDQVEAFNDTWVLDADRIRAIQQMPITMRDTGIDDSAAKIWKIWLEALKNTNPKLLAYLSYMAERLMYLRTRLKNTASVYVHCDQTASHYLKVIMDGIFGHRNFRNELIWERIKGHKGNQHPKKNYGKSSDSILFYTKSNKYKFFADEIATPYENIESMYPLVDSKGRYKRRDPFRSPGAGARPNLCYEYKGITPPHISGWRVKKEKLKQEDLDGDIDWVDGKLFRKQRPGSGIIPNNIWTGISCTGEENLDYKTQKPVEILERIIKASSEEGDLVLDPFCGCGTTMEAAELLGRNWIGIDIAIHAIKRVARTRLEDRLKLKQDVHFIIDGVPRSFEGALDLWKRDKYHFQKWAVEQVDGFVTKKKTSDGGIDGHLYFEVDTLYLDREIESMILEVKGGKNVSIQDLRSLKGVLDNSDSLMAGLIVLQPLSDQLRKNFSKFIGEAGDITINKRPYEKIQVLTVQEILNGDRFKTPWVFGKTGSGTIGI